MLIVYLLWQGLVQALLLYQATHSRISLLLNTLQKVMFTF